MLLELLKAAVAIIAMLGLWVAVEAAWRRTFPQRAAQKEASAGHGCHTCGDKEGCDLAGASATPPTASPATASPPPASPPPATPI